MPSPTSELWHTDVPIWCLAVRAAIVYIAIIFLIRISGKRQVGQMGMPEFVALLLISNAVQNAMNGGDNSLVGGLILATTLMALAFFFAWLTFRSRRFESLLQGNATLLIHKGELQRRNLRHELLSLREFRHLLRKQGIHDLNEVEEAVLESDGYITVIRKQELKEFLETEKKMGVRGWTLSESTEPDAPPE